MRSVAEHLPIRRAESFVTLDILRGIAAISVVILHFRPLFSPIRAYGGYLAVDLFFLISGFVLAHAYDKSLRDGMTATAFLRARIVRLLPFYGVGLVLGVAQLAYFSRHQDIGDIIAVSSVFSLFLIPTPPIGIPYNPLFPANVVFWTLFFEIIVNAIYAMTIKWQNFTSLMIAVALAGLMLAVVAVLRGSLNGGGYWADWDLASARASFSFFAGVLIVRLDRPQTSSVSRLSALGAVLIVVAALFWRVPVDARGLVDALLVLFVFPAVLVLATRGPPQPTRRLDRVFGEISYPIYVLQIPLLSTAMIAIEQVFPNLINASAPWLGFVALIGLATASWSLATWWERPLRRRLGGLGSAARRDKDR